MSFARSVLYPLVALFSLGGVISFYFKVDDGIINTTTPVNVLTNLTVSAPPNSKAILLTYVNIGPNIGTGLRLKNIVNNVYYNVHFASKCKLWFTLSR